jgi:plastocyanin
VKRLALAAAALLAACATIQPAPGGGFEVAPASARASPGGVVRLAVQLATGAPPVTWTTTAGAITAAGALTVPGCSAALPLTVTVTATSGTQVATSTIQVEDTVTGIVISPAVVKVAPGGTVNFVATVKTTCFPAGTAQNLRMKRPKDGGPAAVEAVAAR